MSEWDVTLLPVNGGESVVVRIEASDPVGASLRASRMLQVRDGIVASATDVAPVVSDEERLDRAKSCWRADCEEDRAIYPLPVGEKP